MSWDKLLCEERLQGRDREDENRSPFERDVDRIVFSEAFRRLQNKTQVHTLAENDHVRNRMTHSIEAASLARSMGFLIGNWFVGDEEGKKLFREYAGNFGPTQLEPSRIAHIAKAATLAHDIGNPPFGHSGESFIQEWFRNESYSLNRKNISLNDGQLADLKLFEGNAQGFRILTVLENHVRKGGLRLTYATLATFAKYPCSSLEADTYKRLNLEDTNEKYCGWKKHGFFESERYLFEEVARKTGLIQPDPNRARWRRHPLSFIVEAADDIAYRFADLEDGVELGLISIDEAARFLISNGLVRTRDVDKAKEHGSSRAWIRSLRAKAQGWLLHEVVDAWKRNYRDIMNGTFLIPLLSDSDTRLDTLSRLKKMTRDKIFHCLRQTRHELAGKVAIDGLLNFFAFRLCELKNKGYDEQSVSLITQSYLRMMKRGPFLRDETSNVFFLPSDSDKELVAVFKDLGEERDYEAVLRVTDWVSGMTDRYCLDTFKTLKGIEL